MTIAEGTHQPTSFLNVLWAIEKYSKSGRLQIDSGSFKKEIFFIDGKLFFYQSNMPDEELEKSISKHNIIPAAQLNWFLSKLESTDSLENELISAGLIDKNQLDQYKVNWMQEGVGHALTWRNCKWKFVTHPWLDGKISRSLQTALSLPKSLWDGAKLIPENDIFSVISGLMKHTFLGDKERTAQFLKEANIEQMEWLSNALAEGCTLDSISQRGEEPITAFRLIYLMYNLGILNSALPDKLFAMINNADPLNRERAIPKVEQTKETKQPQDRRRRRSRKQKIDQNAPISEQIEAEYNKRIGKDYYGFLGAKQAMTYKRIDTVCRQLTKKLKGWLKESSDNPNSKEKVQDLLMGIKLVHSTLTDPIKRAEYDSQLETSIAPMVENPRAAFTKKKRIEKEKAKKKGKNIQANDPILSLFSRNEYEKALPLLQKSRQQNPSDPDILARLGWAIWRVKHDFKGAEDYLKLALTFDGKHLLAVEWYAHMLVQKKEKEQALKLVLHLLKLSPNHSWAQSVLPSLQSSDEKTNKGWFR
jgi:tetratricopeptide (TPR) repeat protein